VREVAETGPVSDAELIATAQRGDADAYGVLYERHAPAARSLARQIVKYPDDVDDVVAEAFARVLGAIKRGNGPAEAFRPYLVTTVRRVAIDMLHGQRRQIPTDDSQLPDPGEPFVDPVVASFDRSVIARAFASLPERWSAVLWYTEVEQAKPAEVAGLLGISANGVSALRQRAREGLSEAYLQSHLSDHSRADCQPVISKLGGYVRGRLSPRRMSEVDKHLSHCADCASACADLLAINEGLRGVLAPALLGASAAGYLESAAHHGVAHNGAANHGAAHHGAWWHSGVRLAVRRAGRVATHHPVASVVTTAVAASIALPILYLVHPPRGHPSAAPSVGFTHNRGTARRSGSRAAARPVAGPAGSASRSPSARPSTTKSGGPRPSRSPSRSPTGPPSISPTSSPNPSPSASASPSPTVSASAKLSVTVQVSGLLNLGVTALVTVGVSDPGTAATRGLTANIAVPLGVSILGQVGSSSWSCSPTASGQTCTHPPISAGATSNLSFNILVISLTGCGNSVVATAVSGTLSATGSSAATVQCGGL
jgi:RNA polymerase sigma factor (sigma-70 family)